MWFVEATAQAHSHINACRGAERGRAMRTWLGPHNRPLGGVRPAHREERGERGDEQTATAAHVRRNGAAAEDRQWQLANYVSFSYLLNCRIWRGVGCVICDPASWPPPPLPLPIAARATLIEEPIKRAPHLGRRRRRRLGHGGRGPRRGVLDEQLDWTRLRGATDERSASARRISLTANLGGAI